MFSIYQDMSTPVLWDELDHGIGLIILNAIGKDIDINEYERNSIWNSCKNQNKKNKKNNMFIVMSFVKNCTLKMWQNSIVIIVVIYPWHCFTPMG
jgi:hypothetical protein